MLGSFDEARDLISRQREVFRDLGLLYWSRWASVALWEVEMMAGDPATAERVVRTAYDDLGPSGGPRERAQLTARLAHALYAQGHHEEAIRYADVCKEIGTEWVMDQVLWRSASAKASARLGHFSRGQSLAREAVELSEATDSINLHGDALMDLAEVLSIEGEMRDAATAAEEALSLYEQKGNLVSTERAATLLSKLHP